MTAIHRIRLLIRAVRGRLSRASPWPFAAFGVALLWRAWFLLTATHLDGDSVTYLDLARHLWRGVGFVEDPEGVPAIRNPPGYPAFLAATYALLGRESVWLALLAQAVLDSIVPAFVYLFARLAWDLPPRFAAVGAMLYALSPFHAYLSVSVMTETLFTFVLSAATATLLVAMRRRSALAGAAAGVLFAGASLTRAAAFAYVPALAVTVWVGARLRGTRSLQRVALALLGCYAVLTGAWIYRGLVTTGDVVPVQAGGPLNLYGTTFTWLDQSTYAGFYPSFFRDPTFLRSVDPSLSPGEGDRLVLRKAVENILADPLAYARARVVNYPRLFVNRGVSTPEYFAEGGLPSKLQRLAVALVFYVGPLALLAFGATSSRAWTLGGLVVAAFWAYTILTHLVLWIDQRFYVPTQPFLFAWASLGLVKIRSKWRGAGTSIG